LAQKKRKIKRNPVEEYGSNLFVIALLIYYHPGAGVNVFS